MGGCDGDGVSGVEADSGEEFGAAAGPAVFCRDGRGDCC